MSRVEGRISRVQKCRRFICYHLQLLFFLYYIDTDEIPEFFLLLKIIFSSRAVKVLFLSFTCENIGVAMVTNTILTF